jgi:hypothetical protein
MKRIYVPLLIASLIAVTFQIAHGESANVTGGVKCHSKTFGTFYLHIDGELDSTTVEKVRKLLEERKHSKCPMNGDASTINSLGGSVVAAMEIGRMYRQAEMPLSVEEGAVCVSACVLVLAGATTRAIQGKVGIHRPFFDKEIAGLTSDKVRTSYKATIETLRGYFRDMNVLETLADDMLRIEPANVRFLSDAELNYYGLTPRDPITQEILDVGQAQKYGIDRREYIRRKAMVDGECWRLTTLDEQLDCRDRILRLGR